MPRLIPKNEAEVVGTVREAADKGNSFEIVSGGTKRSFGRPPVAQAILDTSALSGIVKYEPEELVLNVRAATPIAEIQALLAGKKQMLGFEPVDWGPLFGGQAGGASLAGVVATNACGARRVKAGAVRDHVIGCRFVNGKAEPIKAGGQVIKNVTGFDLPKLMCGAFGTLGVMTELTMRVSPRPSRVAGLAIRDCGAEQGLQSLRVAANLAIDASGLAYLPGGTESEAMIGAGHGGAGIALIRVEGTHAAIKEKLGVLRAHFADRDIVPVEDGKIEDAFRAIGNASLFAGHATDVWRLSVPAASAAVAADMAAAPLWYADWAGGLLWLGLPASEDIVLRLRAITARFGGHATLLRGSESARMSLPIFEPESVTRAGLTRAIKAAFDPKGIFNPGRMFKDA